MAMKTALKTLLFTVLVPGTVTVYLPCLIVPVRRAFAEASLVQDLGLLPILLGAAIYAWCAWDFTVAGRGTPAPIDPPKELVARGLYRYSRNPMYVGVLTILFGEALWLASWRLLAYAGLIALCFTLFVRLYEEPALRRQFGASYEHYCQTVPRWI